MLPPPHSPLEPQALALAFILALGAGGGVDGDLWWASTDVTTVVGSGVIGKHFTANHYDYAYVYTYNYITENGTNLNGIICPDDWRLPTKNEWVALLKLSGFTGATQTTSAGYHANINGTGKNGKWMGPGVAAGGSDASKYPYTTDTHIFIPFAGYRYDGINNAVAASWVGSLGAPWSSTPADSSTAYDTDFRSSAFYWRANPRTYALSIRCVADAL